MKAIFYFILLSALSNLISAQSPIVITEDDLASAGNSIIISNANPLSVTDPDLTGADYEWDYSALETINTDTSIWLNEEETNPVYFWLWLSSDIAEQSVSDIVNDFLSVEDVFNYYAKDEEEFALTGFAGTIGGIPLPVSLSEDDLIYALPLEYGNSFSSTGEFSIDIPGIGSWYETRDRSTTVDGWGTVITPYQTYEVLRTKSVVLISDVITYDAIEIPFSYTTTEYKWLAKNGGIPVLQINAQTVLGAESVTQVFFRNENLENAVINSGGSDFNIRLVNTIVDGNLIVQSNMSANNLNAEIIDLDGRILQQFKDLHQGINNLSIVEGIPSGFYIINFTVDGNVIASNKFFK